MSEKKPIVGASVLVQNNQDDVLLVKRLNEPGKDLWAFPGGKVDAGETVEEAAVREVKEETNIDTKLVGLLGSYDIIGEDYHFITVCYIGEYEGSEIVPGDDVDDSKWVSIDELETVSLTNTSETALSDADILR